MISSCTNDSIRVDDENVIEKESSKREKDPTSCYDQSVIPSQYFCDFVGFWSGDVTLDDYPGCTFQVFQVSMNVPILLMGRNSFM